MRNKILIRFLLSIALLILAIPVVASAQTYNRYYERSYDYNSDRRDVHDAIVRLDNSSARLESDLNYGRQRRVLGGLFWVTTVDNNAIVEVRDFRRAVRDLRSSSRGGFALDRSVDEARMVLDRGVQLDRYLRLRTGRTDVDADLADIRSNLHVIADAYGLSMPY
jgi:hypothetical protein